MTRKAPAIVVVDPLFSGAPFCEAVRAAGCRLITIVSLPPEFFRPPLAPPSADAADLCVMDHDVDRVLARLRRVPWEIGAVVAGAEAGVTLADRLASALGLPHNDPALLAARRNKWAMKVAARRAGLACAAARRCFDEEDLRAFVRRCGYPVVLKTPEGASTSQVYRCDDWAALRAAFDAILGSPNLYLARAEDALAEEFIEGEEFIVDTFSDRSGVHVTDVWRYRKIAGPTGDTRYYDTIQEPNGTPALAALEDFACRLTRAVGIRVGPAHVELKQTPRGPVMIEIGARPAGGRIPLLGRETSSFDLYRATLEAHLAGRARHAWPVRHHALGWLVDEPVERAGVVCRIDGIDRIRALPSYRSHSLAVAVGDRVGESTSLHDMALLVCLANPDRAALAADAAATHAAFSLRIETAAAA